MKKLAYGYSCLMVNLPEEVAEKVRALAAKVPDEDIFDDGTGEKGREDEVHVTVKYGIHTTDPADVEKVLGSQGPLRATLRKTSVFWNDESIVLKIGVQSEDLTRLNKLVSRSLECTDKYPDYKPHVTVAYLKKDMKDPYYFRDHFTSDFDGMEVELDTLVFSTPEGGKKVMKLSKKVAKAAREVKIAMKVTRRMTASTRSMIGIMEPSGRIKAIYCHYDSYNNLGILQRSYASPRDVALLIEGGDIKSLEDNPSELERYGKGPTYYGNYDKFMDDRLSYMFLFIKGRWHDVTESLPSAGPMREKQPMNRSVQHEAETVLRIALGARSNYKLRYEELLTFTEGTSNKFHYFAIFEDPATKECMGGNAYGRIGGRPTAIEVARGDRAYVEAEVYRKLRAKRAKGYQTVS